MGIKQGLRTGLSYMLVVVGVVLICSYLATVGVLPIKFGKPDNGKEFVEEQPSSQAVISSTPPQSFEIPPDEFPADKLFITAERQQYKDGQIRLLIPKLWSEDETLKDGIAIENGVTEEALKRGPGLYDQAQLPGTGNRNVSIAGHRDIHGSYFYYVDKLTEGDYLYLIWQDTVYRYTYRDTTIVKADDWGPIFSQGFSCLTLTSCDPIGTSLNRIIVRGELSERTPYTDSYIFRETYK